MGADRQPPLNHASRNSTHVPTLDRLLASRTLTAPPTRVSLAAAVLCQPVVLGVLVAAAAVWHSAVTPADATVGPLGSLAGFAAPVAGTALAAPVAVAALARLGQPWLLRLALGWTQAATLAYLGLLALLAWPFGGTAWPVLLAGPLLAGAAEVAAAVALWRVESPVRERARAFAHALETARRAG